VKGPWRNTGALSHVTEHCAPCGGWLQVGAQGARQRSRLRAVAVGSMIILVTVIMVRLTTHPVVPGR